MREGEETLSHGSDGLWDQSLLMAWGGGGTRDFGLKTVRYGYFTEVTPPHNS